MSGMELGIFFALSTAFSWALAGVIHTSASRLVGIKREQPLDFILEQIQKSNGLSQ